MPSIIIREINNTTGGDSTQLTDVAYVPGFVSIDTGSKPAVETEVKPGVPTIVYNVSDFEAYFGKKPAVFKTEQAYPSISRDGKLYAFDTNAIPADANGMFVAGDVDPGYVYAKELINLGIPVIYERINGEDEEPSVDAMYNAMLGTDAVTEDEYTQDAGGSYIITENATAPIVDDEEPTSDSVYQPYNPTQTYYKSNPNGDQYFIDNIQVACELATDENASYFVQDDAGDWYPVSNHMSKNADFEMPYAKLSAREHTNIENGVRDLRYWYVEDAEGDYLKSLNTFVDSSVAGDTTNRYTISEASGNEGNLVAVQEGNGVYYVTVGLGEGQFVATLDQQDGDYFSFQRTEYGEVTSVYYPVVTEAVPYSQFEATNTIYFDNSNDPSEATDSFPYKEKIESEYVLISYPKYSAVNSDIINTYRYTKNTIVIEDGKAGIFENLKDKGEYNVKFLTSGGYPTYEFGDNVIVSSMIDTASNRGDCVALIDHTNNSERSLNDKNPTSVFFSVYNNSMHGGLFANGSYASMFTPWGKYAVPRSGISIEFPASFGYLAALGLALRTSDNWVAIAGATRGVVPYFNGACTKERLTNALADAYQNRDRISINPITVIKPYGNLIWGNRTLYTATGSAGNNLNAWSFLNYRNMASDIKKLVYETAKRYTFEQNSDILWINFKSSITQLLDRMKSGYALDDYKIKKGVTKEKAKLVATITIIPIYPVEDFDITLIVEDDEVSVS